MFNICKWSTWNKNKRWIDGCKNKIKDTNKKVLQRAVEVHWASVIIDGWKNRQMDKLICWHHIAPKNCFCGARGISVATMVPPPLFQTEGGLRTTAQYLQPPHPQTIGKPSPLVLSLSLLSTLVRARTLCFVHNTNAIYLKVFLNIFKSKSK